MAWVAPQVLIDFAAQPLDPLDFSAATDITQYVQSISTDRGKQAEDDDHVQAGTATIVLENDDGRFDPNNTGSPYAPNVKPMKRLRVRATNPADAVVYDLFTGYIMSWPQQYADGEAQTLTTLNCVDAFTILANETLPDSYFEYRLSQEGEPDHYWRLNESDSTATVARDSGGAASLHDGVYEGGAAPGAEGMVPNDPDSAATLPGTVGDVITVSHPDAAIQGGPNAEFTVVAVVKTTDLSTSFFLPVLFFNAGARLLFQNDSGPQPGALQIWMQDSSGSIFTHNTGMNINEGDPHLVIWRQNPQGSAEEGWDLYVDDWSAKSSKRFSVFQPVNSSVQSFAGTANGTQADTFLSGALQKVAVFNRHMSDQEVVDLTTAWNEGTAGDSATIRVATILDVVGWPSADRNLEVSSSRLIAVSTESRNVLDYLQEVELSEGGLLTIDPSGTVRFTGRLPLYRDDTYNTAQSTWDETGAGSNLDYESILLDSVSVDDVRNKISISRPDVTPVEISDGPSQSAYGVRAENIGEIQVNTEDQVQGAAEHHLNRRRDPSQRVKAMQIRPADDDAKWTEVLSRKLMDRVHVVRTPNGEWTALDADAHIIGIKHEISEQFWKTTWRLSSLDTATDFLILDDANLGTLSDGNSLAW